MKAAVGIAAAALNTIFANVQGQYVAPVRRFQNFTDFVILEESHDDSLDITEHPVLNGVAIADHAYKKPADVTIKFLYSAKNKDLWAVYNDLLELQKAGELFDVSTGKRDYSNMILAGLQVSTDAQTENALSVTCNFREIMLATAQATTLPPRENQKMPNKTASAKKAGDKNLNKISNEQAASLERSALFSIVKG